MSAAPAQAETAKHYVPPQRFNASFQVMELGLSNVFGLFRSATSSFEFDEQAKTISRLKMAIDAGGVVTAQGGADRDFDALFGKGLHPEITFVSLAGADLSGGKAEVSGTLTVQGASKPATFEIKLNRVKESPDGGNVWRGADRAVGISMRGIFKRSDFGVGAAPDTEARFGDEVTLLLEMQAIRQ